MATWKKLGFNKKLQDFTYKKLLLQKVENY